jgi:hypothetical protein
MTTTRNTLKRKRDTLSSSATETDHDEDNPLARWNKLTRNTYGSDNTPTTGCNSKSTLNMLSSNLESDDDEDSPITKKKKITSDTMNSGTTITMGTTSKHTRNMRATEDTDDEEDQPLAKKKKSTVESLWLDALDGNLCGNTMI